MRNAVVSALAWALVVFILLAACSVLVGGWLYDKIRRAGGVVRRGCDTWR